ncbi:MAG: LptF/LptG family permease [Gemmatimonadetes bacterium]|nr:LptF/LptG family permease [Gemmatimonadota bacterium]
MRVRLLDRYVANEFLRLFVLFALAAPLLFILFDLTDHLDTYRDRGLSAGAVALSYVYQLPLFVLYAFPVAALIATIFTVNGMSRHSEVAAAKAGGISFYRVFAPLPLLGVLLTLGALALSELVPVTNRLRAQALGEKGRLRAARTDFVYRTRQGQVFAIRRLDMESGRIYGLSMEREGDEPQLPGVHLVAQVAGYDRRTGWTLEDGYLRFFPERGEERTFQFQRLQAAGFRETPEELLAEPKDPDEMRYAELGRFIDVILRSGGKPFELMVKRAQKIAIPVATLIVILFAAPLATTSQRGGPAYGVGVSLGITILYLMLFKITGAAGVSGTLPPLLAAWLPNAIFLCTAGVLVARIRT